LVGVRNAPERARESSYRKLLVSLKPYGEGK
jgi:hypothetical protein